MRIVYLLTSLGVGGAEKQALAVAERMAKRGHTVAVLVLMPRLPEEWPTAIRTLHLDVRKTPAGVLRGFKRGRDFLREFRPDQVHSHSFHANIFARLLRVAGLPFVVVSTVHNVYEGGWWRMLAYRLTDRLSLRTVAVSQAAADRFTRLKAVPWRKCSVILNGIDLDAFAPDRDRGLAHARRWELQQGAGRWESPQPARAPSSFGSLWAASLRRRTIPICSAPLPLSVPKDRLRSYGSPEMREETSGRRSRRSRKKWDRRGRPLAWPAARYARASRRCRCICLSFGVGGNAARRRRGDGDGEACRCDGCRRRSRTRRSCGCCGSRERFPGIGRSDADHDAREQGSSRYAWPCRPPAHRRSFQHGRDRRHMGGALRFVDREP
jgi:hypothetical protein